MGVPVIPNLNFTDEELQQMVQANKQQPYTNWVLSRDQLDELRDVPQEFWEGVLSSGKGASDAFFQYLSGEGYTEGLDPDTFFDVLQGVVFTGGVDELVSSGEIVDVELVSDEDKPARPIAKQIQSYFASPQFQQQPPVQTAVPPGATADEDKDEDEEDDEGGDQKYDREEFIEIARALLGAGLGPGGSGTPLGSLITGASPVGSYGGAYSGPSFQTPIVGGTLGGSPLMADSRSTGPAFTSAAFAPEQPTQPGATGEWETSDDFLDDMIDRLDELGLLPKGEGEGGVAGGPQQSWGMSQQAFDILAKWFSDESYADIWTGGGALGGSGAYDFLVAHGFVDPEDLSAEDFTNYIYPLLQANGPQFLLDNGYINLRPRYVGEEIVDPFPGGELPETEWAVWDLRSDAVQLLYNWLSDPTIRTFENGAFIGTIRDYWAQDADGNTTFTFFKEMGILPDYITYPQWQSMWKTNLYPAMFGEGITDALGLYYVLGQNPAWLNIVDPPEGAPPLTDMFDSPPWSPDQTEPPGDDGDDEDEIDPTAPVAGLSDDGYLQIHKDAAQYIYDWLRNPLIKANWLTDSTGNETLNSLVEYGILPGGTIPLDVWENYWKGVFYPQFVAASNGADMFAIALQQGGVRVFGEPGTSSIRENLPPILLNIPTDPLDELIDGWNEAAGAGQAAETQKLGSVAGGLGKDTSTIDRALELVSEAEQTSTQQRQDLSQGFGVVAPEDPGEPGYLPGEEKQQPAPQPQQPATPTAMPQTAMPQQGAGQKGQPSSQQMGEQVQDLSKGLMPQGPQSPLAGGMSQASQPMRAPTGRGMFSGQ